MLKNIQKLKIFANCLADFGLEADLKGDFQL